MIQSTIGELLDGFELGMEDMGHHIYVVRDGDIVFYIGRSDDPLNRLMTHMGKGTWSWCTYKTNLGYFIEANLPESRNWQIELLSLPDCKPYISKAWPSLAEHFDIQGDDWDNLAEQAMIKVLYPCLNTICNAKPTPLPKRYKRHIQNGEAHGYMK